MAQRLTESHVDLYGKVWHSYQDIFPPIVAQDVKKRWGKGIYLTDLFYKFMPDRNRPVDGETWSGYEDETALRSIHIATSTGAGTAGASATYRIAADDIAQQGSAYKYYPKIGMIVQCPGVNGRHAIGRIEAVTETGANLIDLTVKPVASTDSLDVTLAGGAADYLTVLSYVAGNGTAQPKAHVKGYVKRDFYSQIFKDTITIEGSELVNTTYFDFGETEPKFWTDSYKDMEMRMDAYIEGAVINGKRNTNSLLVSATNVREGYTAVDGIGNPLSTIKGILAWQEENGWDKDYTSGALDMSDIEDIGDNLRSQGVVSGTVLLACGYEFAREVDNFGYDFLGSGTVTGFGGLSQNNMDGIVNSHFGGTKDLSLSLGFKVLRKDGFDYVIQVLDTFSNPTFLGAAGSQFPKMALVFPLADVSIQNVDSQKIIVPNMAIRPRAKGGHNRGMRTFWYDGAGMANPAERRGDIDKVYCYTRQDLGFECYATNQYGLVYPA